MTVAVEVIEDLDGPRDDWRRLAEATGHPFATWEWNSIWWRHYGNGRSLYSFLCRDGQGAAAAILPLYVARRRPVGLARFLGYADLQSPVCGPRHRPLAAAALTQVTRRPYACRALFAERLPVADWGGVLAGSSVHRYDLPLLRFGDRGWEELTGEMSRKHRGNLRRAEQRLIEKHGLTMRLATDPARLEEDMRTLFRLHATRWGEESTGVFAGPGADFHLEVARAALAGGWLRLWLAEIDGEPVAAWYGFRFAGMDWHLQGGRDPRFDKLSVGTVLWIHTIREASRDGLAGYHFLAGDESYKLRFATETSQAESVILGSRPLVASITAALQARRRLAGLARRRR